MMCYLLNCQFFDGTVDNFPDGVLESVEFHGKDILQGECVWIHVKLLSSLAHQLFPMSGIKSNKYVQFMCRYIRAFLKLCRINM